MQLLMAIKILRMDLNGKVASVTTIPMVVKFHNRSRALFVRVGENPLNRSAGSNNIFEYDIVYPPNKYREIEGV